MAHAPLAGLPADFDPRRSLRARIALVLGLCGLLFAVTLSWQVERAAREQLDRKISEAARREALLIGNSVSALLKRHLDAVRRLAARPEIASDLLGPRELGPLLEQVREQSPEVAWLGLARADGRLQLTTGHIAEGESVALQSWFQGALHEAWVGTPHTDGWLEGRLPMAADGQPRELIELAVPVIDYEGRTVGVLVAAMDWQWVREHHRDLAGQLLNADGQISLLLAGDGRVVLGRAPAVSEAELQILRQLAGTGQTAVLPGSDAGSQPGAGGPGPQLAAAAAVRPVGGALRGGQWLLVVQQDLAAALRPHKALRQRLWALGALAALAFAALSWVLAGHFVRPVRRLAETAQRLQRGETVRFDRVDAGDDEDLRLLADTLHGLDAGLRGQMAAQQAIAAELEAHRSHLQELVDARTAELTKAIEARTVSEAFTRTVADHLPGLVAYWDNGHRLRFANRAFLQWFRLAPGAPLLQPMAQVVGDGVWQRLQQRPDTQPDAPVAPGDPSDDLVLHDALGIAHRFWPQKLANRRDGAVQGHYWFAIDVTRIRVTEQRLHDLNRELRASRDKAEAANLAKSAFLANMSHEIRTPLNAIVGMGYLIGREPMAADNPERAGIINDAANHLLGVISDLLDLSKIESGRFSLDEAPFDLGELIGRTVSMVRQRADDKGLELAVVDTVREREWLGDGGRLSQALLNLVGNAVKFADDGQVRVVVRRLSADASGALLRFEVHDAGPGVDSDTLNRLFAPFVQADVSRTRRHGGSGLGLAISRQIARLMGGDAGARSQLGVGSEFWFTVRLKRPPSAFTLSAGSGGRRPAQQIEQALREHCADARVLLVEDNPVNELVASELLGAAGLQVVTARDGAEAVQRVVDGNIDLVLMDVHMPGMDGLEATRRIRAMPQHRQLPIVAMTANAFADERRACLQAGMDDHLAKPVDPKTLYRVLLQWLPTRQGVLTADDAGVP